MNNKEETKNRYSVIEGNPSRQERMEALFNGKTIKVKTYTVTYYRLDKYQRLCFSSTNHESSYQPYHEGFNYAHVLDDIQQASNSKKTISIID